MNIKISPKGTPKNLKEMIFNSFELQKKIVDADLMAQLQHDFRDYLAQKFNVATLKNPEAEIAIQNLFLSIFKE